MVNYLCSENKDADQLCSYCTADLRLCFRLCNVSSLNGWFSGERLLPVLHRLFSTFTLSGALTISGATVLLIVTCSRKTQV